MTKYVTYLRVSTEKQGANGLGIEAQRSIVNHFAKSDEIYTEFLEVESGTTNNRPQLTAAIKFCKETGATLLVAKLDRLYRNVLFTAQLMESGIEFIACDAPFASKITIHILSAIAEFEATRISERTKDALKELKRRGKKLGTPANLTKAAREKGLQLRQSRLAQDKSRKQVKSMIKLMMADDSVSINQITKSLQEAGFKTTNGSPIYRQYVTRLVKELSNSNNHMNEPRTRSLKTT